MAFNESRGNMYPFVGSTWNPIKGECEHDCSYCYMKKWGKSPVLHQDMSEYCSVVPNNSYIFIGSSTDIFARIVPNIWLTRLFDFICRMSYKNNKYLLQTKNPERMCNILADYSRNNKTIAEFLLSNCTFAATVESDRHYPVSKAPDVRDRMMHLATLKGLYGARTMVSIEPVLDFDLEPFADLLIKTVRPNVVSIGADSQNHNLPEPPGGKVLQLIERLRLSGIEVVEKGNLGRITKSKAVFE